jgi:hypothetical protein
MAQKIRRAAVNRKLSKPLHFPRPGSEFLLPSSKSDQWRAAVVFSQRPSFPKNVVGRSRGVTGLNQTRILWLMLIFANPDVFQITDTDEQAKNMPVAGNNTSQYSDIFVGAVEDSGFER